MSGSASTDPITLDDSDEDTSQLSKTKINLGISERQHQLPTRHIITSRARDNSHLNDKISNGSIKQGPVFKQPPSISTSRLFHPAKKPDIRPPNQKPILHQSTVSNSTSRLSSTPRSSPIPEVRRSSPSRKSRTRSPIQDDGHSRRLTASSPSSRLSLHPKVVRPLEHANRSSRSPSLKENNSTILRNTGEVANPAASEKQTLHNGPPGWKGLGPEKNQLFTDKRPRVPSSWQPSPSTPESETSVGRWFRPLSQQPPSRSPTSSTSVSSQTPARQRDSVPVRSSQVTVEIDNTVPISRDEYKDVGDRKRGYDAVSTGTSKRPRRETSTGSSIISHHDLHLFYAYNEDDDKRKRLGQPKARTVDRKSIPLELNGPILDLGITEALDALSLKQIKFLKPRQQIQRLIKEKFEGIDGLSFTNDIDGSTLDGKFEFTDSYIPSDPEIKHLLKNVRPEEFYTGCNCKLCDAEHCTCVYTAEIEDDFEEVIGNDKHHAYQINSDQSITLRDDFLTRNDGIIRECNATCGCGPDCLNRLVQRGRTVPLDIFQTKKCGFGVRSPIYLKKGAFIDTYLGELVSERTLDAREKARNEATPSNQVHTSYVFSLDKFDDRPLHVDGANFGSPMRFVNHSCEPNCKVITVIPDVAATSVYSLAFFTTKDITPGTELTIDYDPLSAGKKFNDSALDEDMIKCYCGTASCRRLLWPLKNPQNRRGRPRKY